MNPGPACGMAKPRSSAAADARHGGRHQWLDDRGLIWRWTRRRGRGVDDRGSSRRTGRIGCLAAGRRGTDDWTNDLFDDFGDGCDDAGDDWRDDLGDGCDDAGDDWRDDLGDGCDDAGDDRRDDFSDGCDDAGDDRRGDLGDGLDDFSDRVRRRGSATSAMGLTTSATGAT